MSYNLLSAQGERVSRDGVVHEGWLKGAGNFRESKRKLYVTVSQGWLNMYKAVAKSFTEVQAFGAPLPLLNCMVYPTKRAKLASQPGSERQATTGMCGCLALGSESDDLIGFVVRTATRTMKLYASNWEEYYIWRNHILQSTTIVELAPRPLWYDWVQLGTQHAASKPMFMVLWIMCGAEL